MQGVRPPSWEPCEVFCKLTHVLFRFFFYYRDIAGAIYPVLPNFQQFEISLDLLLQRRASMGGIYHTDSDPTQGAFGVSLAYLGLLFAVLASGCQSSDLPAKERELTSQVYGMMRCLFPLSTALLFYGWSYLKKKKKFISLLLLPMPTNDEFPIATFCRSYTDITRDRKCTFLQHESRCLLCSSWYVFCLLPP